MIRVLIAALGFFLSASSAHSDELSLNRLMEKLANHPGGLARFVETRYIALLEKPLVSSGEMSYSPPDRLEKRTRLPKPELLLLDNDQLSLERGNRRMTIRLSSRPEVIAFVGSIRGLLAGNQIALTKSYLLNLQGSLTNWTLTLHPKDSEIARLLQRITVTGRDDQIQTIEYLQADGDRSVLKIEPVTP